MRRKTGMEDFEKEGFLGNEIEEYKNNRNLSDTEKRAKTGVFLKSRRGG